MRPPRPPSFSPTLTSLLWGVGLGIFIWIGLLAVEVSRGTAILFGIIGGTLIFSFVRLFGNDPLRR